MEMNHREMGRTGGSQMERGRDRIKVETTSIPSESVTFFFFMIFWMWGINLLKQDWRPVD